MDGSGLTLNLTANSNPAHTANTLTICRDINDTVNIGTGWTFIGIETINSEVYSVYTQSAATLNVTNVDDTLNLVVTPTSLSVTEGATNTFTVKLAFLPTSAVTVNVARLSGDTDLTVSAGAALTFTTTNWNIPQTVTLAATEGHGSDERFGPV